MIDNRLNPNPPRASSNTRSPASSGPRCVITSRIDTSNSRPTLPRAAPYSQTPQMPHIKQIQRSEISSNLRRSKRFEIRLRHFLKKFRHHVIPPACVVIDFIVRFRSSQVLEGFPVKSRILAKQELLGLFDRSAMRDVYSFGEHNALACIDSFIQEEN